MKERKYKVKELGLLLGIVFSCFAIALMVIQNVGHFKKVTLEKEIAEVSYLTHLLIKQEADVFSSLIFHNVKSEELQSKLDTFVQEDLILNASLYAVNGNLLAVSNKQKNGPVNTEEISFKKQDVVEPIYYRDNLEGFLRITINRNYLPENQRHLDKVFFLLYAQEIILFLLGIILTMSIYYFVNITQKRGVENLVEPFEPCKDLEQLHQRSMQKPKENQGSRKVARVSVKNKKKVTRKKK